MREASIVAQQVLLIFMYIAVGFVCVKANVISEEASRGLSSFVHRVISPSIIISGLMRPLDAKSLEGLGLAYFLSFIFYGVAILVACLAIRKRDDIRGRVERFGVLFSNCGFMAIPLVSAAVGEAGVFYLVAFISTFQVLMWSVGYILITGEKKVQLRRMLLSPGMVATAVGLLLFFSQLPVPGVFRQLASSLASANSPVAMANVGMFLAGVPLGRELFRGRILYASFLRLAACPLASLLIIKLLGVSGWSAQAPAVILAAALAGACPSPAATSNFPAMLGYDGGYGAQIVAITTMLSIITLPAVAWAAQFLC